MNIKILIRLTKHNKEALDEMLVIQKKKDLSTTRSSIINNALDFYGLEYKRNYIYGRDYFGCCIDHELLPEDLLDDYGCCIEDFDKDDNLISYLITIYIRKDLHDKLLDMLKNIKKHPEFLEYHYREDTSRLSFNKTRVINSILDYYFDHTYYS